MGKYTLKLDKDRLAESKKRVSDYYNHKPVDRIPFTYYATDLPGADRLPSYSLREMNEDMSRKIEADIAGWNLQQEGFPDTDFIPSFNSAFLGEGLIPTFFGAKQVLAENNPPFTEGRVLQDIDDLYKLPERIDPEHDGWGPKLMQWCDMCLDATNGEVPIEVCDHQSPYGIATKIMQNENLMMAMYDDPDAVHHFMDIVTTAIDDTIEAMEKRVGKEHFVKNDYTRVEGDHDGLVLWDDYVSVLNPKLHEEFCRPYITRLFEKHGYGHLHTCGPYFPKYVDAVLGCKPKSINCAIYRNMSRNKEDLMTLGRMAREQGVILVDDPWYTDNDVSIFDSKHEHRRPDEEMLTELATGGSIYVTTFGSKEQGLQETEMWKRISARVL